MAIIQTHLIGIAILIVIFISMLSSRTKRYFNSVIFYFLIGYNFLIILFDAVTVLTTGVDTPVARALLPMFNFLYYFMHVIIISVWVYYVDYHIYQDTKRFKYLLALVLPFNLINTILAFLSLFGNYYFYIDANNVYHRGQYFFVAAGLSYGLIFITIIYMVIKRHRMKKSDFLSFILFPAPPMIAAVIQITSDGLTLIWPFMAIAILAVYISVQSKITSMDSLTGVSNRREYEFMIENRTKNTNKTIGGIMIDVNDLKVINDKYMHHAGDMALIKLAEILKKSIRKDDFVARIGGDEFFIIFDVTNDQTISKIVERIREQIEEFNDEKTYPFELSISIGYGVYNPKQFREFKDFIKELDKKMYDQKVSKKID